MFSFVHEVMEIYYQKKLLSLANNRIETYVALRLQGINAQKLDKDEINITRMDGIQFKAKQCVVNITLLTLL